MVLKFHLGSSSLLHCWVQTCAIACSDKQSTTGHARNWHFAIIEPIWTQPANGWSIL